MSGLRNRGKDGEDTEVDLTGIGLSRYRIDFGKSHFLCNLTIQLLALFVVSFKKFQERSLCSGSPLTT